VLLCLALPLLLAGCDSPDHPLFDPSDARVLSSVLEVRHGDSLLTPLLADGNDTDSAEPAAPLYRVAPPCSLRVSALLLGIRGDDTLRYQTLQELSQDAQTTFLWQIDGEEKYALGQNISLTLQGERHRALFLLVDARNDTLRDSLVIVADTNAAASP
jgi:hypothetical protein